jgi:hypothetical protein
VACRREFVTALERQNPPLASNRHKDCPSGVLALLTFSLRQATRLDSCTISLQHAVTKIIPELRATRTLTDKRPVGRQLTNEPEESGSREMTTLQQTGSAVRVVVDFVLLLQLLDMRERCLRVGLHTLVRVEQHLLKATVHAHALVLG